MSDIFNYLYKIIQAEKNINLLCNNKYGTYIKNILFGYDDDLELIIKQYYDNKLDGIVKDIMFLGEYKNGVQHGVEVIYDVGGVYSLSKYVNDKLSGWSFVIDDTTYQIHIKNYNG